MLPPDNAKKPLEKPERNTVSKPVVAKSLTPPVPAPKQRNRREENEEIKQGKIPEGWQDNPNRLRQIAFPFFVVPLTLIRIIKSYMKPRLKRLIKLDFRQYLGNNQILIRTELGFPLIILGTDISMSPCLLIDNVWEPHLTSLFNRKVKSNMTIIDIGANIGYFSALFASKGACVHAFEPNPLLQETLRKNIHMNSRSSTSKDVFVNQCAVGSSEEVISVKFPRFITGSSSLLLKGGTSWGDLDPGQDHEVDVNVITLDQYSKLNNLEKVDIIKIDVESYEEEVLKGARNLITRQQNLMLCMEYTKNAYSNDFLVQLFSMFSKAYLPEFDNHEIGIKFLEAYEQEEILPSKNSLDIVFLKDDRFA